MSSTTQDDDYDDAVEFGPDGRKIDSWRSPWKKADLPDSSGDFAETHGLFTWALPFKYYKVADPYLATKNMAEHLQSREPYRRQVSNSEMSTASGVENTGVYGVEEIALMHGWWKGGSQTSTGVYFCNPENPHDFRDDEILACEPRHYDEETAEERERLARLAASLGLSSAVLVPVFDVSSPRRVTDWCRTHDIQYSELRLEGLKTMARTCKTILHWESPTKTELASVFNIPRETLYHRLDLVADFEPPDEPSIPVYEDEDKVYSK